MSHSHPLHASKAVMQILISVRTWDSLHTWTSSQRVSFIASHTGCDGDPAMGALGLLKLALVGGSIWLAADMAVAAAAARRPCACKRVTVVTR